MYLHTRRPRFLEQITHCIDRYPVGVRVQLSDNGGTAAAEAGFVEDEKASKADNRMDYNVGILEEARLTKYGNPVE